MWPNPQETADLVVFTEEILNGKLQFLCYGARDISVNTGCLRYSIQTSEQIENAQSLHKKCLICLRYLKLSKKKLCHQQL